MTLEEIIVNTAIETDSYDIDFKEILRVAAMNGCLHHFRNIVELCEESGYDLKDIITILLNNNDTKGIAILARSFSSWESYIPALIDNDDMLDVVLGYVDEIEDESILKMLAERGNMEVFRFVDDLRLYKDDELFDTLIEIAFDNNHQDLHYKLVFLKEYAAL